MNYRKLDGQNLVNFNNLCEDLRLATIFGTRIPRISGCWREEEECEKKEQENSGKCGKLKGKENIYWKNTHERKIAEWKTTRKGKTLKKWKGREARAETAFKNRKCDSRKSNESKKEEENK